MTPWPVATLGEIADKSGGEIRTGPFGSQLHSFEYTDDPNGIPVVMPLNMGGGRVDMKGIARITAARASELGAHVTRVGDVLLSRRGDIGRYSFIDVDSAGALCGTGSLRVSIQGSDLLPEFLCLYLETEVGLHELQGRAVGSTMPNINAGIVRSVALPLPPLAIQRKVAAIMAVYDQLLHNTGRRIRLLEEMARRIYHEWFVECRSPGHESVPRVDPAVGLIPEGWAVNRMGDKVELVYGKALKADARRDGLVSVYGSGGVIGHHDQALAEGPGIIVGRKGNVGSVYWSDGDFFAIDTTYWVRSQLPLTYCYYALRELDFLDSHAAVPGLSRDQAYSLPLLVPDSETAAAFDAVALEFFALRRCLESATGNLKATRDFLLPRLVSGGIDVAELDIAMPDVAV